MIILLVGVANRKQENQENLHRLEIGNNAVGIARYVHELFSK